VREKTQSFRSGFEKPKPKSLKSRSGAMDGGGGGIRPWMVEKTSAKLAVLRKPKPKSTNQNQRQNEIN
jgi:hypothetical protein